MSAGQPRDERAVTVNMALNGWELTEDAIPATVLDLVEQGVLTLDGTSIVVPEEIPFALCSYEEILVGYLRSIAANGVVQAEAVDTKAIFGDFWREADAEAARYGWTRERWTRGRRALLILLSGVPAVLLAAIIPWTSTAELIFGGAIVIVIVWYFLAQFALRGPAVRPTALGAELTATWRSYRFGGSVTTAVPADIVVLARKLIYATAAGKAGVVLWLWPWGVNDPRTAWSQRTGTWRRIRISYPWMLGWGRSPWRRVLHAGWKLTVATVLLFLSRPELFGAKPVAHNGILMTFLIVLYASAALDLTLLVVEAATRRTRVGQVLRHRPGDDFVALEHGDASMVRAYRMAVPGRYLKRGTEIRFRAGKGIGWVTNVRVG